MLSSIAPYSEPIAVQDIFVTDLSEIEDVGGGCRRFIFTARHRCLFGGGIEQVVAARLVAPLESIPPALFLTARTIGFRLIGEICSVR